VTGLVLLEPLEPDVVELEAPEPVVVPEVPVVVPEVVPDATVLVFLCARAGS